MQTSFLRLALPFALALLLSLSGGLSSAYACPKISGWPDINCDQSASLVVLGDSVAYGFGDTANGNKGGYVLRAQKKLPLVDFHNFGVPGERTFEALTNVRRAFSEEGSALATALDSADVVIIDIGRNDRWLFGPPIETFRQIKRLGDLIRSQTTKRVGSAPLVITADIMLPNRGSQGPWVKELNGYILRSNSAKNVADLRFDLVSKRLLSSDQIHPTSEGYAALAKTLVDYLKKKLPIKAKTFRPDTDGDGVYDLFETLRYQTDPKLADTDGDGKSDGVEIFTNHTDALVVD